MEEKRTAAFYVMCRPSVRRAIDQDADAKGQPLTVWFERLLETVLADLRGDDPEQSL